MALGVAPEGVGVTHVLGAPRMLKAAVQLPTPGDLPPGLCQGGTLSPALPQAGPQQQGPAQRGEVPPSSVL